MSNLPTVHLTYQGDNNRTRIVFDNGDSEDVTVTPLGSDLYRLEESSFWGEIRYLDVIRATVRDDGSLLFKEVVKPSELATESWVLSKEIMASGELRAVLDRVIALGGNWEQAFGGVLMVHVPKQSMEMIAAQIKSLNPTSRT